MKKNLEMINGELWLLSDQEKNMHFRCRIKEILFEETISSKQILILESYDFGKILVIDGHIQTTTTDGPIWKEMITHVPLSLHPNPKKVLIIGGGDCGATYEVAKYEQVERIDFVEIDEEIVQVSKTFLPEVSGNVTDPRINYIYIEASKYIPFFTNHYDVIIVESDGSKWLNSEQYTYLDQALKEKGIMVTKSQDPILYYDQVEKTYQEVSRRFPFANLYLAPMTTRLTGVKSFTLGSKSYYEMKIDHFNKKTKYVTLDILKSCFQLPQFLRSFSTHSLLEN